MEDIPESKPQTVASAEAAALLLDLSEQRFLHPFLGRENTVSGAAAELSVSHLTTFRRVKRLEAHGLVRVVRRQKRSGRAVQHYRSTAECFFLPAPLAPIDKVLEDNDAHWQRRLLEGFSHAGLARTQADAGIGLRVYRTPNGRVVTRMAYPPGPRWGENWEPTALEDGALFYVWRPLKLEFSEAKALQQELTELLQRYGQASGSQSYLLRLALVPQAEEQPATLLGKQLEVSPKGEP